MKAGALEHEAFSVDGVRLEAARWRGSGVPILMLHEGLGSVAMWRGFPASLAAATGRPVLAWSRQGYGGSTPLLEAREPEYMHEEAARLPKVMDALGLERAVLFGHSDGGSIALMAAAWSSDRVEALILEAPHVFVERLTVESIARVRDDYRTTGLALKLGRYHRDVEGAFWGWNDIWLDRRFLHWNIEDVLPSIRAPCLLIQGLDDEYGTLDQIDRIAAAVQAPVRRVELSGCGHSPHRDQAQAVLDAGAAFLGDFPERWPVHA